MIFNVLYLSSEEINSLSLICFCLCLHGRYFFFHPLGIWPLFPVVAERVHCLLAITKDNSIYSWRAINSLESRKVLPSISLLLHGILIPFYFISLAHPPTPILLKDEIKLIHSLFCWNYLFMLYELIAKISSTSPSGIRM